MKLKLIALMIFLMSLVVSCGATDTPKDFTAKLWDAIAIRDTVMVRRLLQQGANVNGGKRIGYTPLMFASQKGFTDVAKTLIKNGASVNARDEEGLTALMIAADNGRSEIVKVLLQSSAQVNARTKDRWTALHYSAQAQHNYGFELSRKRRGRPGIYAPADPIATVKLLLAYGAQINAKDSDGWTPLMLAANNRFISMVKALIAKGADINIRDRHGVRILSYIHDEEMIQLLKQAGAKE